MASVADTALQWALSKVGAKVKPKPHVSGRFVQQAYRSAGIQIPHSTVGQIVNTRNFSIPRRLLAPGDLVFPDLRTSQIYLGNGQVIGVNNKGEVTTKPLTRYWKGARLSTPGGGVGLSLAKPGKKELRPTSQITQIGHIGPF